MKQYITVEQLNELSEKTKERLYAYWESEKRYLDKAPLVTQGINHYITGKGIRHYLPLLSIGQMIEILEDFDCCIVIQDPYNEDNKKEMLWGVYGIMGMVHHSKELCDALWEAVREVLEK